MYSMKNEKKKKFLQLFYFYNSFPYLEKLSPSSVLLFWKLPEIEMFDKTSRYAFRSKDLGPRGCLHRRKPFSTNMGAAKPQAAKRSWQQQRPRRPSLHASRDLPEALYTVVTAPTESAGLGLNWPHRLPAVWTQETFPNFSGPVSSSSVSGDNRSIS